MWDILVAKGEREAGADDLCTGFVGPGLGIQVECSMMPDRMVMPSCCRLDAKASTHGEL